MILFYTTTNLLFISNPLIDIYISNRYIIFFERFFYPFDRNVCSFGRNFYPFDRNVYIFDRPLIEMSIPLIEMSIPLTEISTCLSSIALYKKDKFIHRLRIEYAVGPINHSRRTIVRIIVILNSSMHIKYSNCIYIYKRLIMYNYWVWAQSRSSK